MPPTKHTPASQLKLRRKLEYALALTRCPVCNVTFKTEHAWTAHLFHRSSKCKPGFYKHILKHKVRHLLERECSSSPYSLERTVDGHSTSASASERRRLCSSGQSSTLSDGENIEWSLTPQPVSSESDRTESNAEKDAQADADGEAGSDEEDEVVDCYAGAAETLGEGRTAHENIKVRDRYSRTGKKNPFYPFSCFTQWEVAHWLNRAGLTQQTTNQFFKLRYVSGF